MADVIGYEEKDPKTLDRMKSGYPRFIVHRYLKDIAAHWQRLFEKPDNPVWLTSSDSMAQRLQAHLASAETKFIKHRGVSGLRLPADDDLNLEAKDFLQHIGGFLSTRQAEDYLVAEGLIGQSFPEKRFEGNSLDKLVNTLAGLYRCSSSDIILANTGMNAFFTAFDAINSIQGPKGRQSWIKLGWLYSDTMHILDKLCGPGANNAEIIDVFELDKLEEILAKRGAEFAGLVTEAPTNPLIQSMDLQRLRELASKHGFYLVLDPTVSSPANIDVSPYADVIVNSLTKYAACEGDVILGALAATERCPDREAFLEQARVRREAPYESDLSRLAYQIDQYRSVVSKINANTRRVVAFLESHPKIKKVYWSEEERSLENHSAIRCGDKAFGGLISILYDGPIAEFYDRVALPKGPSFGMKSTLLCPYIYLAHYKLIMSEEGRRRLDAAGIHPDLLRISIGTEPAEEIIAALSAALDV